jgi:hypothetical protein
MHAIWAFLASMNAFMASAVILQGMELANKIFMGRWPWILSFREKKTELK